MDWLSVDDAAEKLKIGPSQVRRLAREGQLPARRIGAVWLIDDAGVQRRRDLEPSAGRPVSAPMAWAILNSADAALTDDLAKMPPALPSDPTSDLGDRKERYRHRRLLAGAPPVNQWARWLRRRSSPRPIWIHPGVIDRLAVDRRLRLGGAPAVVAAGLGLSVAGQPSLFYVDAEHADAVVKKYRARDDANGPVTLMVIPPEVPARLRPERGAPIPPGAALVDLLASPDARERYLATDLLGRAAARLRGASAP